MLQALYVRERQCFAGAKTCGDVAAVVERFLDFPPSGMCAALEPGKVYQLHWSVDTDVVSDDHVAFVEAHNGEVHVLDAYAGVRPATYAIHPPEYLETLLSVGSVATWEAAFGLGSRTVPYDEWQVVTRDYTASAIFPCH